MGFKIGICGAGAFSRSFARLFKAHPLVDEVILADLIPERARELAGELGITRTGGGLDELCESDCEAIVIMTQRQLHGPQVVQALRAGKHVYTAAPLAQTVNEARQVVKTATTPCGWSPATTWKATCGNWRGRGRLCRSLARASTATSPHGW